MKDHETIDACNRGAEIAYRFKDHAGVEQVMLREEADAIERACLYPANAPLDSPMLPVVKSARLCEMLMLMGGRPGATEPRKEDDPPPAKKLSEFKAAALKGARIHWRNCAMHGEYMACGLPKSVTKGFMVGGFMSQITSYGELPCKDCIDALVMHYEANTTGRTYLRDIVERLKQLR